MSCWAAALVSYRRSIQWMICLTSVWFLLNVLDIATTYRALSTGMAVELNPLMALLLEMPVVLVAVKMLLAYTAVKIVERIQEQNRSRGLLALIVMDIYLALVCLNNFSAAGA